MSSRSLWLAVLALFGGSVLVVGPVVAGPVLHERFDPNPAEDLRLGATTPSGKMPATLKTRSGMVVAPEESHTTQAPTAKAYGGGQTSSSADANYHIDRLTTRPDRVQYDEPFRPSILPFKRLYAFDRLKDDLSFGVESRDLIPVEVGGTVAHTEDAFFGDFQVDLVADVPVRIPSVGPGAHIRAFHVDPPQEVEIVRDSAENWFARGEMNGRVRMVMQLSIERQVFGSAFRPVGWGQLRRYVPTLPAEVQGVAREVATHVGVDRGDSPARALMTLVDYFRRFKESSELPVSTSPRGLYRELSFSQKGVCRHRAYAFAITALSLGIPTRVVHNEAHAWVEVFDTEMWHRVDLGGAATNVQETRPDPMAPSHRPPSDPFTWPEGSTSGRSLASRTRTAQRAEAALQGQGQLSDQSATGDRTTGNSNSGETGTSSSGAQENNPSNGGDQGWPGASQSTSASDALNSAPVRRAADVSLRIGEKKLLRGRPLAVSGEAKRDGRICRLSRVDIYVKAPEGLRAIGSVATDQKGQFKGHVTLPPTTPVGKLELAAHVAGGCGG